MNNKKKWVQSVTSTSLDFPIGTFTKSSIEIAKALKKSAKNRDNPFLSAMSMLNFYINRAGSKLKYKVAEGKLDWWFMDNKEFVA